MGFSQAVRVCIREKYLSVAGRASRSEFWWFAVFIAIIAAALSGARSIPDVFGLAETSGFSMIWFAVSSICLLALAPPLICAQARRLHDLDLSGWWLLAPIACGYFPYLGLPAVAVLAVVLALKGTAGANRFGPA